MADSTKHTVSLLDPDVLDAVRSGNPLDAQDALRTQEWCERIVNSVREQTA